MEHGQILYPHFAMNCAIRCGHLDIVKYLYDTGISCEPSRMLFIAASYGHMNVIKWLLEKYDLQVFPTTDSLGRVQSSHNAMDQAAGNGHLHVLTFLHCLPAEMEAKGNYGGPMCSEWALVSASGNGHFDVLKWICNSYPRLTFPSTTTSMAARNGHLHILQWLHLQDNVEWCTDAMDFAAENGHLGVVKWLHINRGKGCTTKAMNFAARNGHLDVVRWLHLNRLEGCTVDALDFSVEREHLEVLLFLRAHRTEGCSPAATIFARGHQEPYILQWLEDQFPGAPLIDGY